MRSKIIFISLALIGYIPNISFADPIAKPPSWTQYNVSTGEKYASVSYFDANSGKKSGAIVTFKTATVYKDIQGGWNQDTSRQFTFQSEKYTRQIDCKYKTMKSLDREFYADDGALKEFGDLRYQEDLKYKFPFKDWSGLDVGLSSALPKLCK